MKITFYFSLIVISLLSCDVRKKHLEHYLSTGIENIKIFAANKEDSAKIKKINIASNKYFAECEKLKNAECIDDRANMHLDAIFPKGMHNFRNVLFEKFKLPDDAKEGENLIRITIGNKNNFEKIEILRYTDEKTKKTLENIFRLKELNVWTSAKIYGIPVNEQFEISVFVKKKLQKK